MTDRNKGLVPFSGNFEPQYAGPLDARLLTKTLADLTTITNWEANDGSSYAYVGMQTTVYEDPLDTNNGVYRLKALPVTSAANWEKMAGSSSGGNVESVNGRQGAVILDSSDVGLENADNTSDLNKPISTATQTALDGKADEADVVASLLLKADQTTVDAITTTVEGKADQADLDALTTTVDGKADQTDLDALTTVVQGKADQAAVDASLALKADLTAVDAINTALGSKADLVEGKVPAAQLPSYVDDVIEVANFAALPATGESGKIYVTMDDNKTYRWGGTEYVEISSSLALGETASTAYRGDRGKIAYDTALANQAAIGTLQTDLDTAETAIGTLQTDLDAAEVTIGGHTTSIGTLETNVGNLQTDLDAVETTVGGHTTAIGTLQTELDAAEVTIGENTAAIATKQDALTAGDNITIETVGEDLVISAIGGETTYTNTDPSVIEVGGIEVGTTFDNTTIQEILDMMLYPELEPTLSAPSSTFTENAPALVEVNVPTNITFTTNFNRGAISPAYTTSGFRSGPAVSYVYTGTGLPTEPVESAENSNVQALSNFVIDSAKTETWTSRVNYSAGEQPLTSKGNNFSTPLAASATPVKSVSVTAVYAYYATTADITALAKQALTNGAYFPASMAGEDDLGNKQTIEYVKTADNELSGIEFYNTAAGNIWEWLSGSRENSLANFDYSEVTRTENGVEVVYRKYTNNSSKVGARQLRFYV